MCRCYVYSMDVLACVGELWVRIEKVLMQNSVTCVCLRGCPSFTLVLYFPIHGFIRLFYFLFPSKLYDWLVSYKLVDQIEGSNDKFRSKSLLGKIAILYSCERELMPNKYIIFLRLKISESNLQSMVLFWGNWCKITFVTVIRVKYTLFRDVIL